MRAILAAALAIAFALPAAAKDSTPQTRFSMCRDTLKKAQSLDVLYKIDWKGAEPRVLVGPTFLNMPIDSKEQFAAVVNCFLTKADGDVMEFGLSDWRTGKPVGRFHWGKLEME